MRPRWNVILYQMRYWSMPMPRTRPIMTALASLATPRAGASQGGLPIGTGPARAGEDRKPAGERHRREHQENQASREQITAFELDRNGHGEKGRRQRQEG